MRLQSVTLVMSLLASAVHGYPPIVKRTTNLEHLKLPNDVLPRCNEAQTKVIKDTSTNLATMLDSVVQGPEWDQNNRWYQTFFGTDLAAQNGILEIKNRFTVARNMFRGNTNKVHLRCAKPNEPNCNGAAVFVSFENSYKAMIVEFCDPFFDGKDTISAFNANNQFDCATKGGVNAGVKTREQVLLHELMHAGITTTADGTEPGVSWKEEDRIVDCFYGAFYCSKIPDYVNSYGVARVNADSHAFLGYFQYVNTVCPANPPQLPGAPNVATDSEMSSDRRCTLRPKRPGRARHPNMPEN